jgi:hypothetical protein
MTRSLLALALLAATSSAVAAPVHYVLDSVSRVEMGLARIYLTGILEGESTETNLNWADATNGDNRYAASRCLPLLLTMLEKPGRYRLLLQIDPATTFVGTLSCGLKLRE